MGGSWNWMVARLGRGPMRRPGLCSSSSLQQEPATLLATARWGCVLTPELDFKARTVCPCCGCVSVLGLCQCQGCVSVPWPCVCVSVLGLCVRARAVCPCRGCVSVPWLYVRVGAMCVSVSELCLRHDCISAGALCQCQGCVCQKCVSPGTVCISPGTVCVSPRTV